MGYSIICRARKGKNLGVSHLALVDRARSRRFWWTSDNANIVLFYEKRSAAEFAASRLKKNGVLVVPSEEALRILNQQRERIGTAEENRRHQEVLDDGDFSWDAHKNC